MTEIEFAQNDPSKQLFLPGIRPYFTKFFAVHCFQKNAQDGYVCKKPAVLLALKVETCDHDDDEHSSGESALFDVPEATLNDVSERIYAYTESPAKSCIWKISEKVYACSQSHLEAIFKHPYETGAGVNEPDLVVNAHGTIEKEIYTKTVWNGLELQTPSKYFSEKRYSSGRESLEELWAREKHCFGF